MRVPSLNVHLVHGIHTHYRTPETSLERHYFAMTIQEEAQNQRLLTQAHQEFKQKLASHAFFRVNNHVIGEDLVQDTFIKVWRYLARGGKIETMKAFLYHVLNGLIIDEYRKRKYAPASLDALIEKGLEPITDDFDRIIDAIDGKVVLRVVQRLPSKYQKIVRMRYIQDLSLTEISRITGQTKNTLAVQTHRGIERLKLLYTQN